MSSSLPAPSYAWGTNITLTLKLSTTPTSYTTTPPSNNSPPMAVIVCATLAVLFLLLLVAFVLAWYRLRKKLKLHLFSGITPDTLPQLPNNQAIGLNPKGDTGHEQRHEFPAQQMTHTQELPLAQFDPRYELPMNAKTSDTREQ